MNKLTNEMTIKVFFSLLFRNHNCNQEIDFGVGDFVVTTDVKIQNHRSGRVLNCVDDSSLEVVFWDQYKKDEDPWCPTLFSGQQEIYSRVDVKLETDFVLLKVSPRINKIP